MAEINFTGSIPLVPANANLASVDLKEAARMASGAQTSIHCLHALANEAISMPGCEAERQLAVLAIHMLPLIGAQIDRILAKLGDMRTGMFDEHIELMGLHVAPYAPKSEMAHE
jgi:hypothetical protein